MRYKMKDFFNEYVKTIDTYIMFQIKETVAKITPELVVKNRAPISLSMGAPTKQPPEFVLNTLANTLHDKGIHTYSTPKGEKLYREAIAKKMKTKYKVELNPETEIYSLIGSKEGIANLIRALINPTTKEEDKEIIMIPDPGYASYKEMIKISGGLAYPVPLTPQNNYMPNMEEVFSKLQKEGYNPQKVKALLINYPNNPLGAVATREYLESIIEFCKNHNILLISDAAYIDLCFDENNKPISVLELEGAKDICVEFYSFSKSYAMTGWRLGWVCGNSEVIKTFGKLKTTLDSGIFKALQKACAAVLNSEEGEEYIKENNQEFKHKQEILVKGLQELGWKDFVIPNATFYLWLPIPPKYKTSKEFTDDLLYTSGIVTAPGEAFGKYGAGFFRVSIVCSESELLEVIERMKKDGFYYTKA